MNTPSDLSLFFGHLHPLLVHLPICLLALLALLELLTRWRRFKTANANAGILLGLTVPAAVGTAICGWLLSRAGGYEDHLLQWHKWTGIATAGVCLVAASFYWLDLKKLYRWSLGAGTVLLLVSSHYGGSLTHGSDYLTRYAPQPFRTWMGGGHGAAVAVVKGDPAGAPAFAVVIEPILKDKCVSCHGPAKSKGGLRLDTFAAAAKGGDTSAAFTPGNSSASLLIKRLLLPEEDENHMPPDGKPQPSADDVALLRWWVDAGASAGAKVADLKPTPAVARIIAARAGGAPAAAPATPTTEVAAVPPAAAAPAVLAAPDPAQTAKAVAELGVAVSLLSPNEPWIQCNANMLGTNFGDPQLAKLAPLAPNIRWLDLSGTRVSDAGLAPLAAMTNLTRLHLERSGLSDTGLAALASLTQLEYLNLYGTAVTDAGLEALRSLPNLKQLYVWQTKVTSTGGQAFAESRIDKAQMQEWQEEIHKLQTRLRDARITVDRGTAVAAPAPAGTNASVTSTNAPAGAATPTASAGTPVNPACPVSGKPVNPAKTTLSDGRLIGFCCDDCKAEFLRDPKKFLAKLDAAVKPK